MSNQENAKPVGCGGFLAIIFMAAFSMFFLRSCVKGIFYSSPTQASATVSTLDLYRRDIGKTAYNATNGVEIGRVVGVKTTAMNGPEQIVYEVSSKGKTILMPVGNVICK